MHSTAELHQTGDAGLVGAARISTHDLGGAVLTDIEIDRGSAFRPVVAFVTVVLVTLGVLALIFIGTTVVRLGGRAAGFAALGIVLAIVAIIIILKVRKFRRERRELFALAAEPGDQAFMRVLAWCVDGARQPAGPAISRLARALAAAERSGHTIRTGPANALPPIEPLAIQFEPILVSEDDQAFEQLRLEATPENLSATRESTQVPATNASGLISERFKRHIQRGGLWWLLFSSFFLLTKGVDCWNRGQITFSFMFWVVMCGMAWIPMRRHTGLLGIQWLIVPSGLLVRTGKGMRFFRRADSVLCIHSRRKYASTVWVARGNACMPMLATDREVEGILRAWLSSVPPPPKEQLSDIDKWDE